MSEFRLPDYPVMDFSGGIRTDKSTYRLKDNELQRGRNFDVDEEGRIVKRRGSIILGSVESGSIQNGVTYIPQTAATPKIDMLINDFSSTGILYTLINDNITGAITALTSTSLTVNSQTFLAATDTFEIEGDLITYTVVAGTTYTITASTVTSNHAAGSPVHQWRAITNPASGALNNSMGVYYTFLNNRLIVNAADAGGGVRSLYTYNNPGDDVLVDISGEPRGLFATNVRDRVYVAGDGSDTSSGRANRVYFSNLADATSWPSSLVDNSFDVEDPAGGAITGLKQSGSRLMVYLMSSIYSFSGSLPVRQVSSYVGAYNHYVIKEIGGLQYTFCPAGVFETNGSSVKDISQPIKRYIKNFNPVFDSTSRVVTNTFAGTFDSKYFLFIGNITDPEALNNVVLVFDTTRRNWTVYHGWANSNDQYAITGIWDSETFMASENQIQARSAMWYGTEEGMVFRCFENRLLDGTSLKGSDLYSDRFSNTGVPIVLNVVTKPYDLRAPHIYKQWGFLKVFSEASGIKVSVQIDNQDPIPLGETTGSVDRFPFPGSARGYRCTVLLDESSTSGPVALNGFIFEDTMAITKNANL